jgi:hypothetical protein
LDSRWSFKYCKRRLLGGAGTQTAGLAFAGGGCIMEVTFNVAQNYTMELLGQLHPRWKFKYCKTIWLQDLELQTHAAIACGGSDTAAKNNIKLKNMMEVFGQLVQLLYQLQLEEDAASGSLRNSRSFLLEVT